MNIIYGILYIFHSNLRVLYTMKVTVRYYGVVWEAINKRTEDIEVSGGSTIRDLMEYLVETKNPQIRDMIFSKQGQVRDFLAYVINGVDVRSLDGFNTQLKDEDVVLLLPPIGGG